MGTFSKTRPTRCWLFGAYMWEPRAAGQKPISGPELTGICGRCLQCKNHSTLSAARQFSKIYVIGNLERIANSGFPAFSHVDKTREKSGIGGFEITLPTIVCPEVIAKPYLPASANQPKHSHHVSPTADWVHSVVTHVCVVLRTGLAGPETAWLVVSAHQASRERE